MATLPYVECGNKRGPPMVFMAGFPDNETSGWGTEVPAKLGKLNRLILMCLPGFERDSKTERKWGYDFEEIINMFHNTMEVVGLSSRPFVLVGHDWGALISLLYCTKHPEMVSKLVLCDVGMVKIQNLPLKALFVIVSYQLFFALAYVLSMYVPGPLGEWFMQLFPYLTMIHPTSEPSHVPLDEQRVSKCYPYYHLWRDNLQGKMKTPRFPTCPLLFMYGTKKHVISTTNSS
eukprot:CAMPEP_0173168574 /NCGR_PEP_ID=MMETSP1141-20130122/226_1 /TAXON_ID=483371 /ORGANISM="non described non described, Strain CCMP2298" /LENGTH=231 /DNA_ID=CAMNT_0014090309 /DNA_START=133 /DNA_END=829 /DNA_ORIENTATION=+